MTGHVVWAAYLFIVLGLYAALLSAGVPLRPIAHFLMGGVMALGIWAVIRTFVTR